ncbi:MAG: hypothetical protein JKY94_09875 [Rhodobacteraceae bacterium]|nr:hypothetical protein [Paracoccaceae bacterium]
MSDKPILFSGDMIRALLDGRKTQTRRGLAIQGKPGFFQFGVSDTKGYDWTFRRKDHVWEDYEHDHLLSLFPYQVGDRIWVREPHFAWGYWTTTNEFTKIGQRKRKFVRDWDVDVLFDDGPLILSHQIEEKVLGWYPRVGRFMHRRDSRITLPVTDVKVEQLQDISEADAIAEGIKPRLENCYGPDGCPTGSSGCNKKGCWGIREDFRDLWNSINGPDAWGRNDWVAAYTFTVGKGNIDNG